MGDFKHENAMVEVISHNILVFEKTGNVATIWKWERKIYIQKFSPQNKHKIMQTERLHFLVSRPGENIFFIN